MNCIKYLNPRTGEKRTVLVTQIADARRVYPYKPYVSEADYKMRKLGFIRANGKSLRG